jgi:hypothetical protein
MTMLGISGHQVMPEAAQSYVRREIRKEIAHAGPSVVGICSLAAGSDQIFAREILGARGRLWAFVPCHGYERTFSDTRQVAEFRRLVGEAETVVTGDFAAPSEGAFFDAGKRVVDACDRLLVVWDGRPARGFGGTADVVAYARVVGRALHVIWPKGVTRE